MSEVEIRQLTMTDVKAFATSENLNVAWPRKNMAEQTDMYLAADVLAITPLQLIVSGPGAIEDWILQVSVYYRDGNGDSAALTIVDKLKTRYPVAKEFVGADLTYQIIRPGDIIPTVESSSGWFFIPVQFRLSTIT